MGQRVALYCRVSTDDQSCGRQERDLVAFAERAHDDVVGIWKEVGSGIKTDRSERKKVMALAQDRRIDAVVVTELTRWGRSTIDLIQTLQQLQAWGATKTSGSSATALAASEKAPADCTIPSDLYWISYYVDIYALA